MKPRAPLPIQVGDVELHYLTEGAGDPIVFVHGGLGDCHYWDEQLPIFGERWRAVAYSRRYASPNDNRPYASDYSPLTDANDLIGLIGALGLGPCHVIAASIGACAALFAASLRPDLVRSLVVAEPPMLRWLLHIPGGAAVWREFKEDVWDEAGARFRQGERVRAVAAFIDYFLGPGRYDRLPAAARAHIMANSPDLEAQTLSTDPFPELAEATVAALKIPVLMLSGSLTRPTHALVDAELERILAHGERVIVPRASHDVWVEQPDICRDATLRFLERIEGE